MIARPSSRIWAAPNASSCVGIAFMRATTAAPLACAAAAPISFAALR